MDKAVGSSPQAEVSIYADAGPRRPSSPRGNEEEKLVCAAAEVLECQPLDALTPNG